MRRSLLILGCSLWMVAPAWGQAGSPGGKQGGAVAPPSATAALAGQPSVPRPGDDYVLGPEDKIAIRVLKHPEYSVDTAVTASGTIKFTTGDIHVEGKRAVQVEELIKDAIRFDLRNPVVTVEVVQPRSRPIYLTGSVGAAGTLEWQKGLRVREALAKLGGPKSKLDQTRATLRRRGAEQITVDLKRIYVQNDEEANLLLQPFDELDIQEIPVHTVYFLGEFGSQGPKELKEGLGIAQAIAEVGGVTDKAALSKALIVRGDQQIPVNLARLLRDGQLPDTTLKLQPGDLFVLPEHEAKVTVLGNVRNPGYHDLPEGKRTTVLGAITIAGGAMDKSKLSDVAVIRGGEQGKTKPIHVNVRAVVSKGEVGKDVEVQAGDIIFVPKSGKMEAFDGLWLMQGFDWVLNLFKFGL